MVTSRNRSEKYLLTTTLEQHLPHERLPDWTTNPPPRRHRPRRRSIHSNDVHLQLSFSPRSSIAKLPVSYVPLLLHSHLFALCLTAVVVWAVLEASMDTKQRADFYCSESGTPSWHSQGTPGRLISSQGREQIRQNIHPRTTGRLRSLNKKPINVCLPACLFVSLSVRLPFLVLQVL